MHKTEKHPPEEAGELRGEATVPQEEAVEETIAKKPRDRTY